MSEESIAALIGAAVYLAMRFIDALIPRGRHFKFVEKFTAEDSGDDSQTIDEA